MQSSLRDSVLLDAVPTLVHASDSSRGVGVWLGAAFVGGVRRVFVMLVMIEMRHRYAVALSRPGGVSLNKGGQSITENFFSSGGGGGERDVIDG